MPVYVSQRFLYNSEDSRFEFSRESTEFGGYFEINVDFAALCKSLDVITNGRR